MPKSVGVGSRRHGLKDEPTETIMARAAGRIWVGSGAYRDRTGDLQLAKPCSTISRWEGSALADPLVSPFPERRGSCGATPAFDLGRPDEDMNPVCYASAKTSQARS